MTNAMLCNFLGCYDVIVQSHNAWNWEAIGAIGTIVGTIATFWASFVALRIAGGFKKIIIKASGYKINDINDFMREKADKPRSQTVYIYNASQRKVLLQDYGYMIGKHKFVTKNHKVLYNYVRPDITITHLPNGNTKTHRVGMNSQDRLPFYILDGEDCYFGLFPKDYSFDNKLSKSKLYVYVKVNEKIFKYYTGKTLSEFLEITKEIKDGSCYNEKGTK